MRLSRRSVLRGLGGGAAGLAAGHLGAADRRVVAQGDACADDANKLVWMVRTVPVENEWEYDVVSPAFAAQHPDICLEILSLTQDDVTIKRPAMLAAKEKLHVWSAAWGNEGNATLLNEGWLEDLTPIIQADGFDTSVFVPGALAFDNVHFSYGDKPVLAGFAATLALGSVTAIVGVSGQGKSTLVDLLLRYGAVSAEVAQAMATGARRASAADMAISVTGIAGPGGETEKKPVGLVYIGLAAPGKPAISREFRFGDPGRSAIRLASVAESLKLLDEALVP